MTILEKNFWSGRYKKRPFGGKRDAGFFRVLTEKETLPLPRVLGLSPTQKAAFRKAGCRLFERTN